MLHERVTAYLASKGLHGEDVPKIVLAWEVAKYSTKGAIIVGCVWCQPLSRVFRRTYPPFRDRVRARVARELERTKECNSRYARNLRSLQARQVRWQGWPEAARARMRCHILDRRHAMRVTPSLSSGIYERIAEWYRTQSALRSEQVAKSHWFSGTASLLALEPRRLAIGLAEGLILSTVLAPVYYPLEFYLVVRYFQRRNTAGSVLSELAELHGMVE